MILFAVADSDAGQARQLVLSHLQGRGCSLKVPSNVRKEETPSTKCLQIYDSVTPSLIAPWGCV